MLKFFLLDMPYFTGLVVCTVTGFAAATFLLDRALTQIASTCQISRLFLVFAVRRARKEKGLPEPIFAEDCRASIQVVVNYLASQGIDGTAWDGTSVAVANLKRELEREMPA